MSDKRFQAEGSIRKISQLLERVGGIYYILQVLWNQWNSRFEPQLCQNNCEKTRCIYAHCEEVCGNSAGFFLIFWDGALGGLMSFGTCLLGPQGVGK